MFTHLQRSCLRALGSENAGLTLGELSIRIPSYTIIGIQRVLGQLAKGDLVIKKENKYIATDKGAHCMRSQGSEYAAAQELRKALQPNS